MSRALDAYWVPLLLLLLLPPAALGGDGLAREKASVRSPMVGGL